MIDKIGETQAISKIDSWLRTPSGKMKLVTTVNAEFVVEAENDYDFCKTLNASDMATPDGISILAAFRYAKLASGKGFIRRIVTGLAVGGEILSGSLGRPVTGVFLFENLISLAREKNWKIFVLGGRDMVAQRTAEKIQQDYPGTRVQFDAGESAVGESEVESQRILAKINRFKPDILFVAYGMVKQETWLWQNRKELKVGVGIGVGGTFDEFLGDFPKSPQLFSRMGLKWLWRLIVEPRRFKRIWRAIVVFPWLVFSRNN